MQFEDEEPFEFKFIITFTKLFSVMVIVLATLVFSFPSTTKTVDQINYDGFGFDIPNISAYNQ